MRTIIETGLFLSGGFLISILQGLILIPNILLISYKKRLFDQPDERKVHSIPVPRLGGISFFPAILVSLCLIIGLFHCVGIPIARLLTDRSLLELLFWVSGCMLLYLIGVADVWWVSVIVTNLLFRFLRRSYWCCRGHGLTR